MIGKLLIRVQRRATELVSGISEMPYSATNKYSHLLEIPRIKIELFLMFSLYHMYSQTNSLHAGAILGPRPRTF